MKVAGPLQRTSEKGHAFAPGHESIRIYLLKKDTFDICFDEKFYRSQLTCFGNRWIKLYDFNTEATLCSLTVGYMHCSWACFQHICMLTLKTKLSLKMGFKVFRWTLVSNFGFLSGIRHTLTYGSDVPDMSIPGKSDACITLTDSCSNRRIHTLFKKQQ